MLSVMNLVVNAEQEVAGGLRKEYEMRAGWVQHGTNLFHLVEEYLNDNIPKLHRYYIEIRNRL